MFSFYTTFNLGTVSFFLFIFSVCGTIDHLLLLTKGSTKLLEAYKFFIKDALFHSNYLVLKVNFQLNVLEIRKELHKLVINKKLVYDINTVSPSF